MLARTPWCRRGRGPPAATQPSPQAIPCGGIRVGQWQTAQAPWGRTILASRCATPAPPRLQAAGLCHPARVHPRFRRPPPRIACSVGRFCNQGSVYSECHLKGIKPALVPPHSAVLAVDQVTWARCDCNGGLCAAGSGSFGAHPLGNLYRHGRLSVGQTTAGSSGENPVCRDSLSATGQRHLWLAAASLLVAVSISLGSGRAG